jgi:hypothetical protein
MDKYSYGLSPKYSGGLTRNHNFQSPSFLRSIYRRFFHRSLAVASYCKRRKKKRYLKNLK